MGVTQSPQKKMTETLCKVDTEIQEREQMLIQIKTKHQEMQQALIDLMKEQYHKKLGEVEQEMEKVKKEREKAMQLAPKDNRGNIEQQYRKKLGEYEIRIRELRRNEGQQQRLQRLTTEQDSKIHTLSDLSLIHI
eukprot:TRINITY_DN26294_c0_g2_i1.p1 TRINITY_DN26294_c0_g2~~TRINITY_DN26294_c0_g2_i1.p1  ORF type:complete len:135 (+),score=37.76 TRINITY_DN26294_c0_g2_i1:218-622(+)